MDMGSLATKENQPERTDGRMNFLLGKCRVEWSAATIVITGNVLIHFIFL
jgi:hypothetical protein